ncbi:MULTISPECIES: hypothetical protein [unclassified Janthinobacterium]|uniref:hypothetical protein n=1 Tax=unclassified Janthinobacterium TaxID=2610881 RepID=UPI00036792A7|nr:MULTISPECIES: hypothetical protein [unclassified Janthinobacterium]MEC5163684.1 hypothetical protein [Janthinobacterium sp. CG_S6]
MKKYSLILIALVATLGLTACEKTVNNPAPVAATDTVVVPVPVAVAGPAGAPGKDGASGTSGATGATGATGDAGATGEKGKTGDTVIVVPESKESK